MVELTEPRSVVGVAQAAAFTGPPDRKIKVAKIIKGRVKKPSRDIFSFLFKYFTLRLALLITT